MRLYCSKNKKKNERNKNRENNHELETLHAIVEILWSWKCYEMPNKELLKEFFEHLFSIKFREYCLNLIKNGHIDGTLRYYGIGQSLSDI